MPSNPPEGLRRQEGWHYVDRQWRHLTDSSAMGGGAHVEYLDSHNRLWVGSAAGRIFRPLEGRGTAFPSGDPGLGFVFAILETSHGIFAAGTNGLAVFRGDRFEKLKVAD